MKKTIAILFVVLMVLTVLSSAGIGAAAPTPQVKYPYVNTIYLDRTKVRGGAISIQKTFQKTYQFSILLNRGLRAKTYYRVVFVNGRNVILVKAFNSDFHKTLVLNGRLNKVDTKYILTHPSGRFELV